MRKRTTEVNVDLLKHLQTGIHPVVVLGRDGKLKTITEVDLIEIKGGGFAISLS